MPPRDVCHGRDTTQCLALAMNRAVCDLRRSSRRRAAPAPQVHGDPAVEPWRVTSSRQRWSAIPARRRQLTPLARAQNGRPERPTKRASPDTSSPAQATSSAWAAAAVSARRGPGPGNKGSEPRLWWRGSGLREHHRALGVDDGRPLGGKGALDAAHQFGEERFEHSSSFASRFAAILERVDMGMRQAADQAAHVFDIDCIESATFDSINGMSSALGRSMVSSSITRPSPRSRMSMPMTSPPTAPIRDATAPSAPGRSASHRRITNVAICSD